MHKLSPASSGVKRHLADYEKIAHHLDVHVGEKRLIGDFGKRRWLALAAHGSSAIDENIDAAEVAECLGYGGLDGDIISGVGHVSFQTAIRGTRDFRGGRLKCSAIPCNQGDIYAFLGKLPRDSLADAAVAASDDGDLIPELQIQRLISSFSRREQLLSGA